MRNLWFRIGLGAAAVFVVGMFAMSLGRQVKAQVTNAIRDGGRVAVPLALLPFQVGHDKIGSIRQIDVQRIGDSHAKRINIRVRLKDQGSADQYAQCLFKVDAPDAGGLFACVPEGTAEANDLVEIGEIRLDPGNLRRPLVLSRDKAGDWASSPAGQFNLQANDQGVVLHATDGNGAKVVQLRADSNGAYLNVQDENGNKVVRIQANTGGVRVDVK
ncbi:MAG: hypothetical protein H6R40_1080, partial [Gemmatimonadetes bacterium]|nr:hypothetical protein [Gemmatimonadota bacterium]